MVIPTLWQLLCAGSCIVVRNKKGAIYLAALKISTERPRRSRESDAAHSTSRVQTGSRLKNGRQSARHCAIRDGEQLKLPVESDS
jgi:hypothetical protein